MVDDAEGEAIRNEVPVERLLTGTHRVLRFTVGRNHGKGWRIDKYLSALLPTISRTMILGWVERGSATVDGVAVHERVRLRAGQRIELYGPLPKRDTDAGYPAPLQVLYRDEWLLAVNKPPGQLAHQAGKTMSGTMINQVQDWFEAEGGDPLQVRLINRIDRDTSGILLLSFDAAVHAQVSTAFAERDLSKEYRAICHGIPDEAHGHWREPLGEGPPESIARVVRPDGQESHTEYDIIDIAGPMSDVRCPKPSTSDIGHQTSDDCPPRPRPTLPAHDRPARFTCHPLRPACASARRCVLADPAPAAGHRAVRAWRLVEPRSP